MRAAIRGARLLGYLTGDAKMPPAEVVQKGADGKEVKVINPEREDWEATDSLEEDATEASIPCQHHQ